MKNEPIRILHVFMHMQCGGAENMIMSIYRNIDREKVQFDFLVHGTGKSFFDDEIKALGGRIFYVPRFKLINLFQYRKALIKFFDEHHEFAAIHGHMGSSACIYLDVAKKYGIYAIAHSHGASSPLFSLRECLKYFLNRRTRVVADYFFACSEYAGKVRFGKKIVKGNRFSVVKNAIDISKYGQKGEHRQSENFVVGHVGRFCKIKNHTFLLKVFKEISDIEKDSKLILVGDGALHSEIEEEARQLGIIDKVIFGGITSDVNSFLQKMDAFVFPSFYEGLGIAVIEAETLGIPCFINQELPQDLYINDNVYGLSLKKSPKEWAEFIMKNYTKRIPEKISKENIAAAGYDINDSSKKMEEFYIKCARRT